MSTSPGNPRRWLSPGFTLFEVLVVLMIVGMVSAISMSIISQIRVALDRIYPNAEHFARLEIRLGMFNRLIKGLVPSRTPDMAFRGDISGFSGLTTYYPGDAWPGEHFTSVRLSATNGPVTVTASRGGAAQLAARTELLQLTCTQARFSYLDLELQWKDRWQQAADWPYLPLAIRFSCDGGTPPLHLIAAIEREGVAIMADQPMMGR